MKIKINDKVICFPPYLSTTWDHVKSLQVEADAISRAEVLVITLNDGTKVKIPHLDPKIINAIFVAHLKYIDNIQMAQETKAANSPSPIDGFPFKLGLAGLENLSAVLEHNPLQVNLAPLPEEVLNKIASIAKIVSAESGFDMPKPHVDCHCLHCQIAEAIQDALDPDATTSTEQEDADEEVSDEDLRFRIWDITQNGEKVYTVSNPLDSQEQYNVYLGDPIGCTCGQNNCEHIKAVLKS